MSDAWKIEKQIMPEDSTRVPAEVLHRVELRRVKLLASQIKSNTEFKRILNQSDPNQKKYVYALLREFLTFDVKGPKYFGIEE
jgi:hypothetical protein